MDTAKVTHLRPNRLAHMPVTVFRYMTIARPSKNAHVAAMDRGVAWSSAMRTSDSRELSGLMSMAAQTTKKTRDKMQVVNVASPMAASLMATNWNDVIGRMAKNDGISSLPQTSNFARPAPLTEASSTGMPIHTKSVRSAVETVNEPTENPARSRPAIVDWQKTTSRGTPTIANIIGIVTAF